MAAMPEKGRLCVTGAGGFLASWVVKLLLYNNYLVNGTLRRPSDEKNAHMQKMEKESEQKLKLMQADLLDYDSVLSAIDGCSGVLHIASPVPSATLEDPEVQMIKPAVKGTMNVLKACLEAKVKRLVYVSSTAAVTMNPKWPEDRVMDESCWSDQDYCAATKNWYFLSKTQAENQAFEFSRENGLDVVSVCPTIVLGPILQSDVNASSLVLLNLLKESSETLENKLLMIVDVRNVAEAVVMAYEKPEAEGRYICTAHSIRVKDMVDKLKDKFPHYNYPKSFTEVGNEKRVSNEKLQKLGWGYRALEETLIDAVESYRAARLLDS